MIRQRVALRNASVNVGLRHDESSKQRAARRPMNDYLPGLIQTNYYYAVHCMCFILVLYGILLNHQKLYTSEECDMTWSRRQFLQLIISPSTDNKSLSKLDPRGNDIHKYPSNYRFFKFIDQRDVRYKSIQTKKVLRSSDSNVWCNPQSSNYNIPIVVYVPGHGGSYEQSRSLGAHGMQLSRRDYSGTTHEYLVAEKLRRQLKSYEKFPDLENFFFDVYAFDFGEEGGALHGWLLERQASYISGMINALSTVCNVTQIHIVAHSMGGVSSRLALLQYTETMKVVTNVITFGSPHNAPLWNWESSAFNVYNKLHKGAGSLPVSIISISGGLRDEMIPPKACYIKDQDGSNSSTSILATGVMQQATIEGKNASPLLGMDHRAIVWCHNLLSEVRYILYNLIRLNGKVSQISTAHHQEMLSAFSGLQIDYIESISNIQQSLEVKNGYWESMLMKTSQLYNVGILVKIYACIGAWYYLGVGGSVDHSMVFIIIPAIGASIFYYWMSYGVERSNAHLIESKSVVVLAFVADGLFRVVRFLLTVYRFQKGTCRSQFVLSNPTIKCISLLLCLLIYLTAYIRFGEKPWLQPEFVLGITLILSVLYLSILSISILPDDRSMCSREMFEREVNYVAWVLLLVPFITIGDLYVVLKGFHSWINCYILLAVAFRFAMAVRCFSIAPPSSSNRLTGKYRMTIKLIRAVSMTLGCWNIFLLHTHEEILLHPLSALILLATICDVIELTC